MAEKLIGSAIFGQSGGPTSVINSSAYGVIRTALDSDEITNVYGAENGIIGVLNDRLFDMSKEDADELLLLVNTPSSELGSCRYKIADPDEDDTDYEDQDRGVLCRSLLTGHTTKFVAVALGQYFGGCLTDGVDGLSAAVAFGSRSTDLNAGEEVETHQRLGAIDTRQCEILAYGRHLALVVAHEDVIERLCVETVFRRRLYHHAIELGEAYEVGGVGAADIAAECCEYIAWRYPSALAQGGIDFNPVLRIFQREIRVRTADLRAFAKGCYETVGVVIQVVDGTAVLVLDIELETVDSCKTWQHVLRVHLNLRIGNVGRATIDFLHHTLNVVALALALAPILEFQREVTIRRRLLEAVAVACNERVDA